MWRLVVSLVILFRNSNAVVEFLPETLQANLQEAGSANVFVSVGDSTRAICESTRLNPTKSASETFEFIQKLKENAAKSQKPVLDTLHQHGVWYYKTFWITNTIYVPRCAAPLISALQLHESVSEITEEQFFLLDPIRRSTPKAASSWGVPAVRAPDVWKTGNTGQGIIVATIDTGVRWTHQDLRANYLGFWYDPRHSTAQPNDQLGHGTHTMGTIVGANGIGVAPGAKWFSCKGCQTDGCSTKDLLSCGQWVACPDEKNGCKTKPHLVSNSWGGPGVDPFFQSVVTCWHAMNIFPIFANGNSGPNCGSSGSPGRYSTVVSVGAFDSGNRLADFSARALSPAPAIGLPAAGYKPDLSGPGVSITSAWYTSDSAYDTISGTSMAAPHVAGVVALILSACPESQTYDETKGYLLNGCRQVGLNRPTMICESGNTDQTKPLRFPNSEYGMGAVDAVGSVTLAQQNGGSCRASTTHAHDSLPQNITHTLTQIGSSLRIPNLIDLLRPYMNRSVQ